MGKLALMSLPPAPADFVRLLANEGEEGTRWLAELPETVADVAAAWSVQVDVWLTGGRSSCVLAGTQAGRRVVLKVPVRRADFERERAALAAWGGRGAVTVLAADDERGALLLPFVAGRTAADLGEDTSLRAAAGVIEALHKAEVPQDSRLPTTPERYQAWSELADRLWAGREAESPVPTLQRERADRLAHDLWRDLPTARRRVLHGDLFPLNLLVPDGGAPVAIDPFGQIGDPATDVADYALRAPGEAARAATRVTRLAELTGQDAARVHAHAFVRSVMGALYLVGVGVGGAEPQLAYLAGAAATATSQRI